MTAERSPVDTWRAMILKSMESTNQEEWAMIYVAKMQFNQARSERKFSAENDQAAVEQVQDMLRATKAQAIAQYGDYPAVRNADQSATILREITTQVDESEDEMRPAGTLVTHELVRII